MGKLIADKMFNNYNKKKLRKRYIWWYIYDIYMMLFDTAFIKKVYFSAIKSALVVYNSKW